jgi:uncharacterized protein (TIGR02594 family)
MAETAVPRHLAIMRGWLGEKEVPGAGANPVIIDWFATVGQPGIKSDEVANCAAAVGASLVKADMGYPLPALETRLLARSYSTYGANARSDPHPGDIIVVPRGAPWQGHVMLIDEVQSSLGRFKCIGANQSDMTSVAYIKFDAEIVAIRRPVSATAKDLLAAGSKGVERGLAIKKTGDLVAAAPPAVVGVVKVAEKIADAPPMPDVTTLDGMKTATEHLGIIDAFANAITGFGMLFVKHPWLIATIAAGIVIRIYGIQAIAARVRSYVAGVPLGNQKEQPQ